MKQRQGHKMIIVSQHFFLVVIPGLQFNKIPNNFMNPSTQKLPGFIFKRNTQNCLDLTQQAVNEERFWHEGISQKQSRSQQVDQYFGEMMDQEQQGSLPSRVYKWSKQHHNGREQRNSRRNQGSLHFNRYTQNKSNYEHKQKQRIQNHQFQQISQVGDQVSINPQKCDNSLKSIECNTGSSSFLPPESKLMLPQILILNSENATIVDSEQSVQIGLVSKEDQTRMNRRVKVEYDAKVVKKLFDSQINVDSFSFEKEMQRLSQSYTLLKSAPQSIVPYVPKFLQVLKELKVFQNLIHQSFNQKNKVNDFKTTGLQNSLLEEAYKVVQTLKNISSYQAIEEIKTSENNLQQIKRFLVFERFCLVVIVYIISLGKLQQLQNSFSNLIKFSMENHLILLRSIIYSESLDCLIKNLYPHIETKELELIKVNNNSINEIILLLSKTDQIFFSTLNKLAKSCVQFTLSQIFNEFLQFLSFYLHKTHLQLQGKQFSTAPSYFLKLKPEKYYLVIDFTQFFIKDKKNKHVLRPFTQKFIREMSQFYQILNYSNMSPKQTRDLLLHGDKLKLIKPQLFSHHFETWPHFRRCVEKISSSRINLIYLNCEQNQVAPQSICIKKWKGDRHDRQLVDLIPVLISIPHSKLNCMQVCDSLSKCDGNIGEMQQSIFELLRQKGRGE